MKSLKSVAMVSNYFNHHQQPLADEIVKLIGDGYTFISTEPMDEGRKKLGWELDLPKYVHCSYIDDEHYAHAMEMIDSADVVIIGSAPEKMIKYRIKKNKLIFRYSERPLKKGLELSKYPVRFIKWRLNNPVGANIYLLCSSAYTAADYARFGLFKNRALKWGYFTEVKEYENIDTLINAKNKNSILWVSRFLKLKHPEYVIEVADRLKNYGYRFSIDMIGCGELENQIKNIVKQKGLTDYIRFLGTMSPNQVRVHMEKSQIFIFTSDFNEGWGAVLNEAMNSGCAVIASHAIGAAPYLVKEGKNGLIFENGNVDDLYKKTKWLLDHPDKQREMGKQAYEYIRSIWSPKEAASRFIKLAESILSGDQIAEYQDGPCSKAEILHNNWYSPHLY